MTGDAAHDDVRNLGVTHEAEEMAQGIEHFSSVFDEQISRLATFALSKEAA
jgi:hypothetical protein